MQKPGFTYILYICTNTAAHNRSQVLEMLGVVPRVHSIWYRKNPSQMVGPMVSFCVENGMYYVNTHFGLRPHHRIAPPIRFSA